MVSLYVVGCSEFETLAPKETGIKDAKKATEIWNEMKKHFANYIPGIGVKVLDEECLIVSGNTFDIGILDFYPEVTVNQKAMKYIKELKELLPDLKYVK